MEGFLFYGFTDLTQSKFNMGLFDIDQKKNVLYVRAKHISPELIARSK